MKWHNEMLNNMVSQLVLLVTSLIAVSGSIYAVRASRGNRNAEQKQVEVATAQVGDQTLIERLAALDANFDKLQGLSDERFSRLVAIETLITAHIDWDFRAVRKFREHGIEMDDPPSLLYIKRQAEAAKRREDDS